MAKQQTDGSRASDLSEIFALLDRIKNGGDVTFEEVQGSHWDVDPELDPLVQRIYRELQMFASDSDIRSRDHEYDRSKRSALNQYHEELRQRIGARQGHSGRS